MLTQLHSDSALEHAMRKVPENQARLKLNGELQLLAHANDMDLLEDNTYIIKKNKNAFMYAIKVVGSRHQNTSQSHDM